MTFRRPGRRRASATRSTPFFRPARRLPLRHRAHLRWRRERRHVERGGWLQLASFGVPVHTVGVGPEVITNDLELDSVTLTDSAAPGEVLNAEVSIRHSAKGKTRLRVYDGEKLLAATEVDLSADAGITTRTIPVPAGDRASATCVSPLDPLKDERNTINNTRTHVMDVTPRRRNILYIEGEPRWGVQVHSQGCGDGFVPATREPSCAPRRIATTVGRRERGRIGLRLPEDGGRAVRV